jgi:surface protein
MKAFLKLLLFIPILISCQAKMWVQPGSMSGPPSALNSTIIGTTGIIANGVSYSIVTITLMDENGVAVVGVRPTFSATDTGTDNSYTTCSLSDSNGISTCRLISRTAEFKSLELLSPVNVIGGSPIIFITQTPYEPNCSISIEEYATGDGADEAEVTITLKDMDNVPVPNYTPIISDDSATATPSICSPSDSSGISICQLQDNTPELVTISLTTPNFSLTDSTIFTQTPFKYNWKTDQGDTNPTTNKTAVLPLNPGSSYNFIAYWGDGTYSLITSDADPDATHTYSSTGTYTIKLAPIGNGMPQLKFSTAPQKLLEVTQWGTNTWEDLEAMFKNCINLALISASDSPSIIMGASMRSMFEGAINFNSNIDQWNTQNVISMRALFKGAINFNQPLNSWDTSSVTDMSEMFSSPDIDFNVLNSPAYTEMNFNQNIESWNTRNVTNMSYMFAGAKDFNHDISNWETINVTNMRAMFYGAKAFNQNISKNGDKWNTFNVTTMEQMFQGATNFNGDISSWNTAANTSLKRTFAYATNFNIFIGAWDTNNLTTLYETFYSASSFDQPFGAWNTSGVTSMYRTFAGATSFNRDISSWNTTNVTMMAAMFTSATSFNNGLASGVAGVWSPMTWNTLSVTNMADMFRNARAFNQDLSGWNTSNVTVMGGLFYDAISFNQPLANWNTSKVTTMSEMFRGASVFNQDISSWDTANVVSMSFMFYGASAFNQPLIHGTPGDWNTSKVTTMLYMFSNATSFNQDISSWDVSKVQNMVAMFSGASNFNNGFPSGVGTLNDLAWTTTALTGTALSSTFYGAIAFNSNINNWDISNVTSLNRTFINAQSFNQPLNSWNTSKVTDMYRTFEDALVFDQDLGDWDTSSVTTMYQMFNNAREFNRSLIRTGTGLGSKWDTSQVVSMKGMFMYAVKFNKTLTSWDTSKVQDMSYMFYGATLYNNEADIAFNWDTSKVTNMSYMFGATNNFNCDIHIWNTSLVTNMSYMFYQANAFNNFIGAWNTSNVSNMNYMFYGADIFDQNISSWDVSLVGANHSNFDTSTVGTWIAGEKPNFTAGAGSTPLSIFITESVYSGNLGGITGADAKCASDTNHPGIGTYKALLGGTARSQSPVFDWILAASTVYQRLDNVSVMTTTASKNFNSISAAFELSGDVFWTGIDSASWSVAGTHCNDWTSDLNSMSGTVSSVSTWSSSTETCDQLKPILCIEQP